MQQTERLFIPASPIGARGPVPQQGMRTIPVIERLPTVRVPCLKQRLPNLRRSMVHRRLECVRLRPLRYLAVRESAEHRATYGVLQMCRERWVRRRRRSSLYRLLSLRGVRVQLGIVGV